jgi:undecaprenyl-diphosphatase 1
LHFDLFQWFLVFSGSVISYIVAILVIQKLMSYIKKHDFQFFGYYRIVLGILVLIFSLWQQM